MTDREKVAIVEIHVASAPTKSVTYNDKCRGTWYISRSATRLRTAAVSRSRDYKNTKKACVAEIETLPKAPDNPTCYLRSSAIGHFIGTETSLLHRSALGANTSIDIP